MESKSIRIYLYDVVMEFAGMIEEGKVEFLSSSSSKKTPKDKSDMFGVFIMYETFVVHQFNA